MYRLLVLLVGLATMECHCFGNSNCSWNTNHSGHRHGPGYGNYHPGHHRHHPCGHNNHQPQESTFNFPATTFEDIGKSIILIDKALKKFCDENNMNITSEFYGQDNYILKYQLPEFTNSDFEIKVMNTLIYTTAESKDGNVKAFKDLRILPATVDTSQASWVFEHKTLKVHGSWGLPAFICDVYIAMDVTSSTSSIFNLVAISVDRYIAVTQPIKYAKHKNNRRVWFTIVLVWMISAAIGAPIVLGLNDTPDRNYNECLFNSQNYVLYSSLGSFYIPCIMMMFLYYNIFKALRNRAKKQRAAKQPPVSEPATAAVVIENVATTRQLETALDAPTNTGSGSNEDDHDDSFDKKSVELEDAEECHVIPNNRSTEFMLATVTEETAKTPKRRLKSQPPDPNGNNDSGYAASTLDRDHTSPPASPGLRDATVLRNMGCERKRNGKRMDSDSRNASIAFRSDDDLGTSQYDIRDGSSSKKERKASAATARFTIYKANKASKKKREKSSAKKERKATKTLAIVLGVFLFCWTPFFTCNVLDAICAKFGLQFTPGVTVFILNTWLGYINSFLNPVIYTIFNPEFRKAFRKILKCGT